MIALIMSILRSLYKNVKKLKNYPFSYNFSSAGINSTNFSLKLKNGALFRKGRNILHLKL